MLRSCVHSRHGSPRRSSRCQRATKFSAPYCCSSENYLLRIPAWSPGVLLSLDPADVRYACGLLSRFTETNASSRPYMHVTPSYRIRELELPDTKRPPGPRSLVSGGGGSWRLKFYESRKRRLQFVQGNACAQLQSGQRNLCPRFEPRIQRFACTANSLLAGSFCPGRGVKVTSPRSLSLRPSSGCIAINESFHGV